MLQASTCLPRPPCLPSRGHATSCRPTPPCRVGLPPGGGGGGPGWEEGGVWRRRGDGEVEAAFWAAGGLKGGSFPGVGLGAGMKPGGGARVAGLGGGRKPTTVGSETGLGLDGTPAGGGASCVPGPDLGGAGAAVRDASSLGPSSSALVSLASLIWSSSSFSGRSSLRRRGRGSLVLPLTVRPAGPGETSSSVLMELCLKAKGEPVDLGAGAGPGVGAAPSLFSAGVTFLTTRRTTFTTFLRVSPGSSEPGRSPSAAAPLATPPTAAPFRSPWLPTGPAPLGGGSGLLNRSGTLTGDLILGGEGLRTRAAASVGNAGRGLLARNNPLPGSRAGTDLACWDRPLLSGCSQQTETSDLAHVAGRHMMVEGGDAPKTPRN